DRDVDLVAAEDPVTGAAGLSPLLADLLAPGVVGRLLQRLDDGGAGGSGRVAEDGDGVAAEVEGGVHRNGDGVAAGEAVALPRLARVGLRAGRLLEGFDELLARGLGVADSGDGVAADVEGDVHRYGDGVAAGDLVRSGGGGALCRQRGPEHGGRSTP